MAHLPNLQLDPEVEDIFADPVSTPEPAKLLRSDSVAEPAPRPISPSPVIQPVAVQPPSQPVQPQEEYDYREPFYSTISGKIAIIVLIILFLGIIATVLYKYTSLFDFSKEEPVIEEININSVPTVNINTAPIEYPIINNTTPEEDSDRDGLTDQSEINEYKTDPHKVDTDGDGLTDREEVKVYLTDPLDVDTDGDGYSDGVEVERFYNPLGSGQLLNLNKAINELNE